MLQPRDGHGQRGREVGAIVLLQLRRVVAEGVEQASHGTHGVVHLVGHHADQLLVGGALGGAQLVGQLLQDEDGARVAAVVELGARDLPAPPAGSRHVGAVAFQGRHGGGHGPADLGERAPRGDRAAVFQDPLRGRVGLRDPALEVQGDDPRRRGGEHAVQEEVLLLVPQPLLAQALDHLVVDVDEPVRSGLAHDAQACREVALADQLGTASHQIHGEERRAAPEYTPRTMEIVMPSLDGHEQGHGLASQTAHGQRRQTRRAR